MHVEGYMYIDYELILISVPLCSATRRSGLEETA